MIDAWTWPAYVGVPFGIGVLLVMLVPLLVVQSRRYGRLDAGRLVAAGALAVYLTVLVFYTLFPLPAPDWCSVNTPPTPQLTPLASFNEVVEATRGLSWSSTLTSPAVLQLVLNVALFVPFGVLIRSVLETRRVTTVLAGLATSVLIELVQGTGILGIVGCAYRVADVDDVLTNTTGTIIGVLLAPLLQRLLPGRAELEARRRVPRPVTRLRRLAAAAVDVFLTLTLTLLLGVLYRVVVVLALDRPVPGPDDWFDTCVPTALAALAIWGPCLIGRRATPGQRAFWLEPPAGSPWWRTAVRPALGVAGCATASAVAAAPPWVGSDAGVLVDRVPTLLGLVALVAILLDRSGRGLSYRAVGLPLVDARRGTPVPPAATRDKTRVGDAEDSPAS